MYKKETSDDKYHNDPFRAVNFKTNENGKMVCPNGKEFNFAYRKPIKGNQYGRQEEYYTCDDCSGCPYAEKCKKTDENRTVRIGATVGRTVSQILIGWIPGIGNAINATTAAGLTEAIGWKIANEFDDMTN